MDNQNKNARRKINMKLKTALLMLLVAVLSFSCIMTANAVTVKDNGKYTLLLTCGLNGMDGKVDGDYAKIIKFDVADGDTTVSLSELTAGVLRRAENRVQIDRTGGVRLLKEHAARAKRRKADSRCKTL